jgi:hypothetical protein
LFSSMLLFEDPLLVINKGCKYMTTPSSKVPYLFLVARSQALCICLLQAYVILGDSQSSTVCFVVGGCWLFGEVIHIFIIHCWSSETTKPNAQFTTHLLPLLHANQALLVGSINTAPLLISVKTLIILSIERCAVQYAFSFCISHLQSFLTLTLTLPTLCTDVPGQRSQRVSSHSCIIPGNAVVFCSVVVLVAPLV